MKWNDKSYSEITTKHPILEEKSEATALAVWALSQNGKMQTADFKKLSERTGINIAGRALGSAREIVGLKPATTKATKRGPGRPKGSKNKRGPDRPRKIASGSSSMDDLVAMIKQSDSNSGRLRAALLKMRELIDKAIEG